MELHYDLDNVRLPRLLFLATAVCGLGSRTLLHSDSLPFFAYIFCGIHFSSAYTVRSFKSIHSFTCLGSDNDE